MNAIRIAVVADHEVVRGLCVDLAVVAHLSDGLTDREIAEHLGLSGKTVKNDVYGARAVGHRSTVSGPR